MTSPKSLVAIYDFELFPYALGDVLTWNVRTAMRCEELGRDKVDIYICADEKHPAGIYQRGLVNPQNFELFFNELYSAFGTHPRLGNIHIFRERETLLERLQEIVLQDGINAEAVSDYLSVLGYRVSGGVLEKTWHAIIRGLRDNSVVREIYNRCLPSSVRTTVGNIAHQDEKKINDYLIKYIHSHKAINEFAAKHGGIPFIQPALGCAPDVDELITRRFHGKKLVSFHLRLRRLDAGYGGAHSYTRDSDFLEWYDFLSEAGRRYPEVAFIALGRIQEKPLELLDLPNVTSLRVFGMGLGHELTLMLKSALFIGTSSGFAALANFSALPYAITKMNPGSCLAYAIPEGEERLPFAQENQKLIYAPETTQLLMDLLETGLGYPERREKSYSPKVSSSDSAEVDVQSWLVARAQPSNSVATTSRFFTNEKYRQAETAYLLLPSLDRVRQALLDNDRPKARSILDRLRKSFALLCDQLPQYQLLLEVLNNEAMDIRLLPACLETLDIQPEDFIGVACEEKQVASVGWRPLNWVVENGTFEPLLEDPQPALAFKATGNNCYWHSERFASQRPDGKITVRFQARNTSFSSRHRIWIFEDGAYRSVGEFIAGSLWRQFEIPLAACPGSMLELQLDQLEDSQWLAIRDFQILDAAPMPFDGQAPISISMNGWSENGVPCGTLEMEDETCRKWLISGKKGYIQTPILPKPGKAGMLIDFQARTDKPAAALACIYLFEGERYRVVARYAFNSEWQRFLLFLQPQNTVTLKLQIDYPDSVELFSIQNFNVVPVDRLGRKEIDCYAK